MCTSTACTGEGTHIRCSSFFIFPPPKKRKSVELAENKTPSHYQTAHSHSQGRLQQGWHSLCRTAPGSTGDPACSWTVAPDSPPSLGGAKPLAWRHPCCPRVQRLASAHVWPAGAGFPLLFSCDINGNDPGFMNPRWKMSGVESRAAPEAMFPFARLTLSRACVAIWNLGQGLVVFPVSKTASTCAVQTKIIVMKLLQLLTSVPSQSVRKRGLFPVCPNKQAVFGVCLHTVGQEEGCAVYKRSRARNTASIAQLYHRWGDTNHVV